MKRLLPIVLAMAAPAAAQEFADSAAREQNNALQTYFACIYQQVVANDDGVSDPATLTPKIAPTCRYLLGTAATIFAKGDQARHDALYKRWIGLEDAQVARTLWAVRVNRRVSAETATSPTAATTPPPAPAPAQLAVAETASPQPAPSRPRPAAADTKPMSEWRRAYIAKHGHEPPVATK